MPGTRKKPRPKGGASTFVLVNMPIPTKLLTAVGFVQSLALRLGLILLAVFVIGGVLAWHYKLPALAWYWFNMRNHEQEWALKGVWLPAYQVAIDGEPIVGIKDNMSGATYNPDTGTLFTVINAPPQVVELTTQGRLLRLIPIKGAGDPEGISHVEGDRYVLADERDQQLHWVRIGPETTEIDMAGTPTLGLAIDLGKNIGFEGVSWDYVGQRLYVAKEKCPLRVLEISGLPDLLNGDGMNLQIREWKSSTAWTLFMTDLSSLTLHEATGNILLLSHESQLIVEYAPDGMPVSILPLWKDWHGLRQAVPQAEGIAVGTDGTLFILSEPNLFYRFERSSPADWAR
ncbi:MAG: SdiA-regulated domain-containing protein [Nitrospirales bacterium]